MKMYNGKKEADLSALLDYLYAQYSIKRRETYESSI